MENLEITGLNITSNTYLNVNELSEVVTTDIQKRVNGVGVGTYNETTLIKSSDPVANDSFGNSISISNNKIVVGATNADPAGINGAGAAYIFDLNGNELKKIQASDAQDSDSFGISVSVSDTRIVVGAYREDTGGSNAGAAYIFDIDGNEIKKLVASDDQIDDWYGKSVAVSVNRIVVGASGEDTGGTDNGAVYIYDINGNELRKIQAPTVTARFGETVSCTNNKIVVGSYYSNFVYIFDIDGNFIRQIQSPDLEANDYFGASVSVSNNRIVAGAYYEDPNNVSGAGSAYIFDIDGNFISKIQPQTLTVSAFFGWSIACNDTRIVVGAVNDITSADDAGAAYIYDINGNFIDMVTASNAGIDDNFGSSVSLNNDRIVVGASVENSGEGAAYIFKQKLLPSTTSIVAGTQPSSVTYANVIDEVYKLS